MDLTPPNYARHASAGKRRGFSFCALSLSFSLSLSLSHSSSVLTDYYFKLQLQLLDPPNSIHVHVHLIAHCSAICIAWYCRTGSLWEPVERGRNPMMPQQTTCHRRLTNNGEQRQIPRYKIRDAPFSRAAGGNVPDCVCMYVCTY
jgi:hypothetical protein